MYDQIETAKYPGDANFYLSVNGKPIGAASTVAAAVIAYAARLPKNRRVYAPSHMVGPMAAGDVVLQQSIDAAAFPSYTSSFT